MNDFNNNNMNNQNYNPNNHNGYTGYSSPENNENNRQNNGFVFSNGNTQFEQDINQNPNVNEFSYNPQKPKKSAGKKVLAAVVAVLCIAAVGTGSIAGYKLFTGDSIISTSSSSNSEKQSNNTSNKSSATSSIDRTNLPTLEQLATPSDALAIPDIVTKASPSVVGISCILDNASCTGSGIIMSADGYIITNAHVVDGAKSISVLLPTEYAKESSDTDSSTEEEDLTYEATLIGQDTQTDIAVLKITPKDDVALTAAEFGTSADIQVGELSVVIGNPLGFSLANSVTAGIISATDRTLTIEDRTMNLLQTDASINSGNSGGPLINAYGQVIGITSAKVSSSYGEGLGFAIPIDEAIPIIEDLMKNGYVTGRPSLGITGTDVSSAYSQYYNIPQGFLVTQVTEGSGAETAGVKVNDIVIGINDNSVTSIAELNTIKNQCKVGDKVTLTVYRDGKMVDLEVVLGESVAEETTPADDQSSDNQQSQDNYGGYGNDGSNGYGSYYDLFKNFGY